MKIGSIVTRAGYGADTFRIRGFYKFVYNPIPEDMRLPEFPESMDWDAIYCAPEEAHIAYIIGKNAICGLELISNLKVVGEKTNKELCVRLDEEYHSDRIGKDNSEIYSEKKLGFLRELNLIK